MAELLIKHGGNVNIQSSDGKTPLHVAAVNANLKFAEVLIKNGAVIDAVDQNGVTPLQLAVFDGNASNQKPIILIINFISFEMQMTDDLLIY